MKSFKKSFLAILSVVLLVLINCVPVYAAEAEDSTEDYGIMTIANSETQNEPDCTLGDLYDLENFDFYDKSDSLIMYDNLYPEKSKIFSNSEFYSPFIELDSNYIDYLKAMNDFPLKGFQNETDTIHFYPDDINSKTVICIYGRGIYVMTFYSKTEMVGCDTDYSIYDYFTAYSQSPIYVGCYSFNTGSVGEVPEVTFSFNSATSTSDIGGQSLYACSVMGYRDSTFYPVLSDMPILGLQNKTVTGLDTLNSTDDVIVYYFDGQTTAEDEYIFDLRYTVPEKQTGGAKPGTGLDSENNLNHLSANDFFMYITGNDFYSSKVNFEYKLDDWIYNHAEDYRFRIDFTLSVQISDTDSVHSSVNLFSNGDYTGVKRLEVSYNKSGGSFDLSDFLNSSYNSTKKKASEVFVQIIDDGYVSNVTSGFSAGITSGKLLGGSRGEIKFDIGSSKGYLNSMVMTFNVRLYDDVSGEYSGSYVQQFDLLNGTNSVVGNGLQDNKNTLSDSVSNGFNSYQTYVDIVNNYNEATGAMNGLGNITVYGSEGSSASASVGDVSAQGGTASVGDINIYNTGLGGGSSGDLNEAAANGELADWNSEYNNLSDVVHDVNGVITEQKGNGFLLTVADVFSFMPEGFWKPILLASGIIAVLAVIRFIRK